LEEGVFIVFGIGCGVDTSDMQLMTKLPLSLKLLFHTASLVWFYVQVHNYYEYA